MQAGKLRHYIDIESRAETKDATGYPVVTWTAFASGVRASIEPLSAKEFVAQDATLGQVVARIVIRYIAGVLPTMRIKHGSDIYNIQGVLPDRVSGRQYLTMPVSRGTNQG